MYQILRKIVTPNKLALDQDVMLAQITAFTRQVPLLYIIGNLNAYALAYTHFNMTPKVLTLIVPFGMTALCVWRIVVWHLSRHRVFTVETAGPRLRQMLVLTALMGAIYAAWALSLYPYGDVYGRCHVAFFMATTVMGTMICLLHLREAALVLAATVTIPFLIRFTTTGQPVFTAMSIDFLLLVIAMMFILFRSYNDFRNLVLSRKDLAALSVENLRIANLDSLTDLPNRRSFFNALAHTVSVGSQTNFAVGLIDLDGFKPINDLWGHAAGDSVLIEVGRRLRGVLGDGITVARLGGDEFGLIVPSLQTETDLQTLGAAICETIRAPISLSSGTARVSASIGFTFGDGTAVQDELLERADYALYDAKANHKGSAIVFSGLHAADIKRKSLIEQTLRRADISSEFTLNFQPIRNVAEQKTIAYEALARWNSPVLGAVSPIVFIEAAERIGLINDLTSVLFVKALAALAIWPPHIGLSFNLSAQDISSETLVSWIETTIEASGIDPERIAFEITETALMRDFEQARSMMLKLKAMGAKTALDDFGTGYSSLSYVHRLPLDKIKIDRSFVGEIASDATSRDIMKSIIDLCRNLKITCVVEGVETVDQIVILRMLGCTTMQGYYLGRPQDEASVALQLGVSAKTSATGTGTTTSIDVASPGLEPGRLVGSAF